MSAAPPAPIDSTTPSSPRKGSPFDPTKWAVITDILLSLCGYQQLLDLRATSRAYRDLCDTRLARHTIIRPINTKAGVALRFTAPAASQNCREYRLPLFPFRNAAATMPDVERMLAKAHVVQVEYAKPRTDVNEDKVDELHALIAPAMTNVKTVIVSGRWPRELPHTGETLFLLGAVSFNESSFGNGAPRPKPLLSLPRLQPFKRLAIELRAEPYEKIRNVTGGDATYPPQAEEVALYVGATLLAPKTFHTRVDGNYQEILDTESSVWRAEQMSKMIDVKYLRGQSPFNIVLDRSKQPCAVLKDKLDAILKARALACGGDSDFTVLLDPTVGRGSVPWLKERNPAPTLRPTFYLNLDEAPEGAAPLSDLEDAFESQTEPFAVGGVVPVTSDHALYVTESDGSVARLTLPLDGAAMTRLYNSGATSAFGRGPELVYDETYRKAREIRPAKFSLSGDIFAQASILHKIQTSLGTRPLYATVAKLNVYAEGGFFKEHRDTPRGDNHLGTITVCLPSTFAGGELVVRHKGEEQVFDWSASEDISWAFLFSDCAHEVLPVKSGMRVTLAYDVFVSKMAVKLPPTPHARISAELGKLLDDPEFLWNGGVLAFGLGHAYAKAPAKEEWGNHGFRQMLKGADAVWAEALEDAGLVYEFVGVYDRYPWDEDDDEDVYRGRVHQTSRSFFACEGVYEEYGHYEGARLERLAPVVHWVTQPVEGAIPNNYTSYGNEPTAATMYVSVAIFAYVGPPGARDSFDDDTFDDWENRMKDGYDPLRTIPVL